MTTDLPPRILKARLHLMLGHPYLAAALARLPLVNAAGLGWCDTMATDGYYIYVNPSFCEPLEEPQIAGVFAHELLHCLLGHLDRRGDRNRRLWNIAIDYAANGLLREFGFELPADALYEWRFTGMTAEEVYEYVAKEAATLAPLLGFDLHLEAGDLEGRAWREDDYPSTEERRRLRATILREMGRELARRQGQMPAGLQREIEPATKPRVSWQQLLARFLSGIRRSDYRTFPFNKKHLWRGIYLPSLGVPGVENLVLAIDTSGSVSAKDLGQFVAELDRLRSLAQCRLTLLHCDAAVQRVDEIEPHEPTLLRGDRRLAGGGGTDFRPVFDWIAKRREKPEALVYCTDGMGTFPGKAPPYPVVWVVNVAGRQEFPFGQVIRLEC